MPSSYPAATYDPSEPADLHSGTLLHRRSSSYKFGLLCIAIGFVFFVTGFSTCQWLKVSMHEEIDIDNDFDKSDQDFGNLDLVSIYGLWAGPDDNDCNGMCTKALLVARILFSSCLLGYLVCAVFAVLENIRVVDLRTYHSRKIETALFLTGGLCCGGLFTFTHFFSTSLASQKSLHFMWSMFLVSLSSTILFIAWLLLLCGNKKPGVGVVVMAPANMQMAHLSCNPHTGHVIQRGDPIFKPGPSHTQEPLLPPAPGQPQEAPPPYSLPPAYPMQGVPGLPHYSASAVPYPPAGVGKDQ